MDKVVYVGPPDFAARKAMFQLHLTGRPCEASIDLDDIAGLTDGRVSSDIKFLVNEAARLAMKTKTKIGTPQLQEAVRNHAPSVSAEELRNTRQVGSVRPVAMANGTIVPLWGCHPFQG